MIFKCKTGEAYHVKVLAELLTNNLKNGCFNVTEEGINLRMSDQPRRTLVDLDLYSENFSRYKFKLNSKKLCLGLNLNHFHKMLKSIKKKDSLELFISEDNPNELSIKTIPKENTRITTSGIKIQKIQNLESDIPLGYGKPVVIPSPDFQKMCKELSSIGSTNIRIEATDYYIDFIADADDILKRRVRLGENDADSDDEDMDTLYVATFTTDQFTRISKISGLSPNIQIYTGKNNLPLMFRTSVGSLGKVSVYIKSKELLEKETSYDSDDSNDD
jgi:proliferating cell nuclear antigen PCNA